MRSLFALIAIALCVAYVCADCDDADKSSEEGVSSWLKNVGCKIKKGAEDLSDSAKPWADKIGSSAKEFGSNVAEKYDKLKHKLTDDNGNQAQGAASNTYIVENAPTEKVPLAPLNGDAQAAAPHAATA